MPLRDMEPAAGNSRGVTGRQDGPHRDLERVVRRHLSHCFQKPVSACNQAAFDACMLSYRGWNPDAPVILDAGCGVGWSTLRLALQHPDHFVIGVDKSVHRLSRGKPLDQPPNAVFVRADLVDFWRLLALAEVRLERHFLLYPNPWPKIGHLARRWPGHAVFPTVAALGGLLECRSNWRTYLEELALALEIVCGERFVVERWIPEGETLTPFERKYLASGQSLYRVVADLRGDRKNARNP